MTLEIITRQDMECFKNEILQEMRALFQSGVERKSWLKSSDVRKILNCSAGTLQNLRVTGVLRSTKVGGTLYYDYSEVVKILDGNKKSPEFTHTK
jgi:hypothetical protein